ncbi:bifunctional uroporphyrin-III C-methyltransferase/uroporphyrinogen-III synthase [Crocosphaera subtropica ATCC 51142]|uniref:uroporphyrinogen-III C-methyltransferase n=1 Tax=Crocosphaera subtropica (strain ATCC 51142 / BH68) TaxID=43989 RepID=B1WNN8_CROS5|nr:uroporphyrinogen-III C-methyltransferase [Crocosphaera subtropica]ACB51467.1 bifunctional uroporphyrin-III C-methyltransferase/uroporphyrinogen-III synthase [Crocosphaera subtropica ATCC 51142]
MIGKVYLVGSGIGNINYLTLRGYHLLSQAQVLIYDALVDQKLLNLVPESCLKIDVGKRAGQPSPQQSQINSLLLNYCLQGKQVVRLKSGDPLIFGRVNEEIKALEEANCTYELVPGISSALAAPLLTGIPLTDKEVGRCFTVLTGHQPNLLNWEALAKIDTLVILMGTRNLDKIVENLIRNGRSPDEPIAIIRNSGSEQEKVWIGTLKTIIEQVSGFFLSPAIIIIGNVVNLRYMSSSISLPLAHKTVLITRAKEQSSQFSSLLQQQGANTLEMPALEILPPSSWEQLDLAIEALSSFDWVIFTSANGVKFFFQRLQELGQDIRVLGKIKIAVVGKKTASCLKQYHLTPDFIPPNFIADSLIDYFPESLGHQKILFPRVETGGRDILVKELQKQEANIVEVPAYQSGCPETINSQAWEALQNKQVNIITFTSSKTVKNFYTLVQKALKTQSKSEILSLLDNICLASIGPQTSKTCYDLLGRVDLEAEEYTLDGLTQGLVNYFS